MNGRLSRRAPGVVVAAPIMILVVAMVVVLGGCTGAEGMWQPTRLEPGSVDDTASLDGLASRLDSQLPALMERYDVPGVAVAIIREGRPVWNGAYGYADREGRRPMTTDTVVRAESISKSLTAWGVLRLVESGALALDDRVTAYVRDATFRDSPFDPADITVGMLLSNTSGLPLGTIGPSTEYAPGDVTPSVAQFVAEDAVVARPPGEGFLYSDVGFNLLEIVVEEASGEAFADYMRVSILTPLGMPASDFAWRSTYTAGIATGYELDGDPVGPYVYPAAASGGLFSTVEDLARFVAASVAVGSHEGGQDAAGSVPIPPREGVLPTGAVSALHSPWVAIPGLFGFVADAYGFGHFVEALPDGRRAVWHGGQGHGWMTHFHAVPESGDGIVIVTNSQRSWPLVAEVLADWSRWAGLGRVRFGRVILAGAVARVLVGLLFLAVVIQGVRLVAGIRAGRRRWGGVTSGGTMTRSAQILAGVGLAVFLLWRISLPYVFESSIFPTLVVPGAAAIGMVGLTLVISGLIPPKSRGGGVSRRSQR